MCQFEPDQFELCQFEPWVGANYCDGFAGGPRLLILGESHYREAPPEPGRDFTRRLTCQYARSQWNHRFWTGIMQTVLGHPRAEIEQGVQIPPINGGDPIPMNRESFWQWVALYNYIQVLLPGPGHPPPPEAWPAARPAFEAVLEALEPQALLILGRRLWDHLPGPTPDSGNQEYEGPCLNAGELDGHAWVYQLPNEHRVLAAGIHHPSAPGFNWQRWHPVVCALLRKAGQI